MENDKELREKLSKVLGVPTKRRGLYGVSDDKQVTYSWEEIFTEIGKLIERANKPPVEKWLPTPMNPMQPSDPNVHYHNGSPCYNNPCTWCWQPPPQS